jgi:hypothetical protein
MIVFDVPSLRDAVVAAPAGAAAATAVIPAISIPRRSDIVIRFDGAWALLAMVSPFLGLRACRRG